jgi:uncharacterized membrane protein YeaQ/YmgE (transglycosylase-associated protein family)
MDTIINLIIGIVAGNAVGKFQKSQNLGIFWNTTVGLFGALISSNTLENIFTSLLGTSLGDIVGSAASGVLAIYLVNFIKKYFFKKKN